MATSADNKQAAKTEEQKPGLHSAFDAIKETVIDLTSLEVQTYTGEITIDTQNNTTKLTDFKGYLEKITVSGAKLKLVAVTRMEFDGDTINMTSETPLPPHVNELHQNAVKAGIETRQGLLTLFGKLLD